MSLAFEPDDDACTLCLGNGKCPHCHASGIEPRRSKVEDPTKEHRKAVGLAVDALRRHGDLSTVAAIERFADAW